MGGSNKLVRGRADEDKPSTENRLWARCTKGWEGEKKSGERCLDPATFCSPSDTRRRQQTPQQSARIDAPYPTPTLNQRQVNASYRCSDEKCCSDKRSRAHRARCHPHIYAMSSIYLFVIARYSDRVWLCGASVMSSLHLICFLWLISII